jgi:hypothetical protein
MHFQDKRDAIDTGDRRGVANEIEFEIIVQGCVDRVRRAGHKQRIAVRWRTHDRLCADIPARSRAVVDDELLAKPLGQPLTNDASDDVDLAAGRNGTTSRTNLFG